MLGCVRAMLGKTAAYSVSSASLGYSDQTAQNPYSWPSQLPTVTEPECTRVMSLQDQWGQEQQCPLGRVV